MFMQHEPPRYTEVVDRLVRRIEAFQARGFRVLALKVPWHEYQLVLACTCYRDLLDPDRFQLTCCDVPLVPVPRDPRQRRAADVLYLKTPPGVM